MTQMIEPDCDSTGHACHTGVTGSFQYESGDQQSSDRHTGNRVIGTSDQTNHSGRYGCEEETEDCDQECTQKLTGTDGTSQIRMITIRMMPRTTGIFRSRSVRTFVPPDVFFRLFIAPANVFMISGRDFRRLITPPVAIAPAPTYLITLDQIALAPFAA